MRPHPFVLFALVLAACTSASPAPAPGTTVAAAPLPGSSGGGTQIRPGIEVFLENPPAVVRGRRVGLITNHTGTDSRGRSIIDLLVASPAVDLVALYSPEHGIRGTAAAGEQIASGTDERTGLPIHSLYGETHKPTPQMLHGVDALLFDIQDIGTRQYTYISTMALSMQSAREKGIPFVVLDRPNPIGGVAVEGNILEPAFSSFVGIYPIPVRHGMTVGELARLFNQEFGIGADLTVVPVQGWRRDMWGDQTGLSWVNPSPNIRRLEAAIHYPGTVFFEATNLSEGRGTEAPFELTGAPWLDAQRLTREMNAMRLPGVRFEAIRFAVEPGTRKFPGQTLPGVRLIVTDRDRYRPVRTSLLLIDAARRMHPAEFEWRGANTREPGMLTIERHGGTARLKTAIESGTLRQLLDEWERDEARFRAQRQQYLLYP
jgi:uncharacterized protein YbbC (DUF1343 family)